MSVRYRCDKCGKVMEQPGLVELRAKLPTGVPPGQYLATVYVSVKHDADPEEARLEFCGKCFRTLLSQACDERGLG
jgi:hypothetical protein